mgnify:CR=1 FL=1|jgi:hypothetical protein
MHSCLKWLLYVNKLVYVGKLEKANKMEYPIIIEFIWILYIDIIDEVCIYLGSPIAIGSV